MNENAREPDMAKAYEPSQVEDGIYEAWEKSGFFNPDNLPGERETPFTVMMPPPNRTGVLHVGHVLFLALQDIIIRFERMRGKKALWVPGTDHASIATNTKVESLLIKEGYSNPRAELGREEFVRRVVDYVGQSGETIVKQMRKMGSSCDWSREAYTFDEKRNGAVNEMFKMMHEDGIIERGYRVVNWDPQFQTTLADDEVVAKETTAKLLTFKYDKDFPIAISSTRPETKFGDTAVAVHPEDERYKQYVGQEFAPSFCGKQITVRVIADEAVDPSFGTGALGVTPAHSMIDADMADRHGLPTVAVIDRHGKMNDEAGEGFAGLSVAEAREKVEATLSEAGVLESVEEVAQSLPVAERGGATVEQLPMRQWFVRVNKEFALRQDTLGRWKKGEKATLKQLMQEAVNSRQVNIVPDRFEKVYFHWINNLRDWCISRQIWFGHRIPMWYQIGDDANSEEAIRNFSGESVFSSTKPEGDGWVQDPDTLDTWFSSGMWTFTTLGWPERTSDLETYHPTDVLETGREIIFQWVARMILMSTYALGEVPFRTTYMHGMVKDEEGRKFSKSLGNGIDPVEMAAQYGTDAVRLSLVIGSTPGNDSRIGDEKIAGYRNFTNKLWNIVRFMSMSAPNMRENAGRPEPKTLADRWILSRLDETVASVTKSLDELQFSHAGETLRDFTWNDLADWYLEIAKVEGKKDAMLSHLLRSVLKMWHPYMPFVTEEIHQRLFAEGGGDFLMVADWPVKGESVEGKAESLTEEEFEVVRDVITAIRGIRAQYKVEPSKKVEVELASDSHGVLLRDNGSVIAALGRAESVAVVAEASKDSGRASAVVSEVTVSVPLGALVDKDAERARLSGEIEKAEQYVVSLKGKLSNEEFVSRAPEVVVEGEKAKLAAAKANIEKLKEQLESMN